MANTTIWWIVTGALVALELATGTFYLLMLAVGAAAGALAALTGASLATQLTVAAVVGGVGAYLRHPRSAATIDTLDVGETVQVGQWAPDGTAQVRYRGAPWTAVLRPGAPQRAGSHRVTELIGSRLVLEPI